jgi:hypothetical protein
MTGERKRTPHDRTAAILILLALALLGGAASCAVEREPDNIHILPSDRLADWSVAGVWSGGAKGIPERTAVFCSVRTAIPGSGLVAAGDGVQDDTAALQAALTLCPEGQVVRIPEGTYRITNTLAIAKGLVVRGDGPDRTKIVQHAARHVFAIEGRPANVAENVSALTSGFARGSSTAVLADAARFNVGDIVTVDQLNDPSLVTRTGEGGACTWCGRDDGARAMAETLLVAAKSGNALTFNRPLYYDYESRYEPQIYRSSGAPVRNAGIEDLGIEIAAGLLEGGGVIMAYCAHCWIRNVESFNIPYKHVELEWGAYGNEIRDSYFHHTPRYDSDHGYGVNVHCYASDNLIENNVLYHLHTGIVLGGAGGAGNVVGYNYLERTEHHQPSWFQYHIGAHGAHTFMNLWEGNVAGKIQFDAYWGSGSHHTVFRNRITRLNPGQPVTSDIAAAIIDANNYYMTFVGNILGTPGCPGPIEETPLTSRWENPVLWIVGFAGGSGTGEPDDREVGRTLIRSGNWECPSGAVQWTTVERTMPDSLYLPARPEWFGGLDWPPFAPERADFDPQNVRKIPAQVRFESGAGSGLPSSPPRGS